VPKRLVRLYSSPGGEGLEWGHFLPGISQQLEYTTLGHCWGPHQPFQLMSSNLTHLLGIHHSADLLPKTYQDAFQITLSLGYQYIWTDSLCIIQGNEVDWLEQSP
ncbi:hypothetical protein B0H67DRAFT_490129, partial [Lasiosphaeris hirsuta]